MNLTEQHWAFAFAAYERDPRGAARTQLAALVRYRDALIARACREALYA